MRTYSVVTYSDDRTTFQERSFDVEQIEIPQCKRREIKIASGSKYWRQKCRRLLKPSCIYEVNTLEGDRLCWRRRSTMRFNNQVSLLTMSTTHIWNALQWGTAEAHGPWEVVAQDFDSRNGSAVSLGPTGNLQSVSLAHTTVCSTCGTRVSQCKHTHTISNRVFSGKDCATLGNVCFRCGTCVCKCPSAVRAAHTRCWCAIIL